MGLYPEISKGEENVGTDGTRWWYEYRRTPGLTEQRYVSADPWAEVVRDNCFCCSCGERSGSDPYCRNHGFAGLRPCEQHKMPGQKIDNPGEQDDGQMPYSVQQHLAFKKEKP